MEPDPRTAVPLGNRIDNYNQQHSQRGIVPPNLILTDGDKDRERQENSPHNISLPHLNASNSESGKSDYRRSIVSGNEQ